MEKEKELLISLRNLYNNDIISQNLKQIVQMEGVLSKLILRHISTKVKRNQKGIIFTMII
jgi:hypothetical protein